MTSFVSILRLLIFLLSLCGYILLLHIRFGVRLQFCPIIIFSCIVSILQISGLLNILLQTTVFIFIIGICILLYYISSRQSCLVFNRGNIDIGTIFVLVAFCYFIVLYRGAHLVSYDDFSHWGTVVKEMLAFNRLPNSQSAVITFKTYPLGSSLFLYYFCRIVGTTESKMLIAQIVMMLFCTYALFGAIDTKKKLFSVVIVIASVYMMIGWIGFQLLSVDTLLPLTAIAAFAIMFQNHDDIKKACLLSMPVLITTALIKNSGMFFVFINILFLLFCIIKHRKAYSQNRNFLMSLAYVCGTAFIVLFMLYLWKQHTNYVFPGVSSKHSLSIGYYQRIFHGKTQNEIMGLLQLFVKTLFNLNTTSTKVMLLFNVGMILLILIDVLVYRKRSGIPALILCTCDILFALYQIGILAMYLFSMPTGEASYLAGYDRYSSSIIIFIIGLLCIGMLYYYNSAPHAQIKHNYRLYGEKYIHLITMMALIMLIGTTSIQNKYYHLYSISEYAGSVPHTLDQLIGNEWESYSKKSYLIFVNDLRKGYIYYAAMYKTLSPDVKVITSIDDNFKTEVLSKFDYFIVLDQSDSMDSFIRNYIREPDYPEIYPIQITFFIDSRNI